MSVAVPLICCSCNPNGGSYNADAEYRRQIEVYEQQAKIAEAQLNQTQQQLDTVDKQQEEMG